MAHAATHTPTAMSAHPHQDQVSRDPEALPNLIREETRRLSSLRMQMLEMHPFWGYLLMQVKLIPAPALEGMAATDCVRRIWFNPWLTRHLHRDQLGFVLAHEVGHQLFATAPRQRGRNLLLWNCATDYAINRIVAEIDHPTRMGKPLYAPPTGHFPELGDHQILLDARFDGMIAETIYELLAGEVPIEGTSITLVLGMDADDAQDADHDTQTEGQEEGQEEADLPATGNGEDEDEDEDEDGGEYGTSHSDQVAGPGDRGVIRIPNVLDHGGGIDVHLPEHLDSADQEVLRERIAAAVEVHERSRTQGHAPADLLRNLGVLNKPRIPWQRVLRRYVGQATAREDYSLSRPSRRYLSEDLLVPGLYSEKLDHLVIAIDSSSSVSDADLEAIGAELRDLIHRAERMTVLVADAELHQVIEDADVETFLQAGKLLGGGGTDHMPVFAWIEDQQANPDLFIGLTDLCSDFPERQPRFPVIWVAPEDHEEPPWGQLVVLPDLD